MRELGVRCANKKTKSQKVLSAPWKTENVDIFGYSPVRKVFSEILSTLLRQGLSKIRDNSGPKVNYNTFFLDSTGEGVAHISGKALKILHQFWKNFRHTAVEFQMPFLKEVASFLTTPCYSGYRKHACAAMRADPFKLCFS